MNANYLFSAMSWYFPWSLWKSKLLVSFYFLSCWVSALGLLLTRNIWFGFFFFYYAVCTVMNTFFLLRLQFLLHLGSNEAKQGGNVHLTMSHSRKKKIPPWYFLCWSQGSMCVWDITSHSEVCGRLLTVNSLFTSPFWRFASLLFSLGWILLQREHAFFRMWTHAWGKQAHLSCLVPGWLLESLTVVLGQGVCAYIGSVIYNTTNFVLLWAAITPLCLVVGTNTWLGEQKHSTAYYNGRPRWMSSEAHCPGFCFHLLQFIQYCFGYAVKNSIKTIFPKTTPECTETALWTVAACFVSSPPQQL